MTLPSWITYWDTRKGVTLLFCGLGAMCVAVVLLHLYLVGFSIYGDGIGYYVPWRSLLFDGDLFVQDEYAHYATMASKHGGGLRWGHEVLPETSKYTLGMGLVLLPFIGLGHLLALMLTALGAEGAAPNGLTWPYDLMLGMGSCLVGLSGLVACYRACRCFCPRFASVAGSLSVALGTSLIYYLSIEVSMSHAVSQGLVSWFLYVWVKERLQGNSSALASGILLGLATLVRPQNLLFGGVWVLHWIYSLSRGCAAQTFRKGLRVLAICLALLLLQVVAYRISYGSVSESPYLVEGQHTQAGASFTWIAPQWAAVTLSGHRGLFFWHPLTLPAALGLAAFSIRHPRIGLPLILAALLQLYLLASWHSWWQGASFGARMLCNLTLVWSLGLAWLITAAPRRLRPLLLALMLLGVGWNLQMMLQYRTAMIPAEAPVTRSQILRNTLMLPRHLRSWLTGS